VPATFDSFYRAMLQLRRARGIATTSRLSVRPCVMLLYSDQIGLNVNDVTKAYTTVNERNVEQ